MLIIKENDRKNDCMWKDHYKQFENKPEPVYSCDQCIKAENGKCKASYKCTGENQNKIIKVANSILSKDLENYKLTGFDEEKKEVYLKGNYPGKKTFDFTLKFMTGYPKGKYIAYALR